MVKKNSRNQVRIIGGVHRGRKLRFPDLPGLRPSGDRVRETLFNWLQPVIQNARCLDLFAGSGALGLEAASRGAREVVMLDLAPQVVRQLEAHQALLGLAQVKIIQGGCLALVGAKSPALRCGVRGSSLCRRTARSGVRKTGRPRDGWRGTRRSIWKMMQVAPCRAADRLESVQTAAGGAGALCARASLTNRDLVFRPVITIIFVL